jgi:hypothetical protein
MGGRHRQTVHVGGGNCSRGNEFGGGALSRGLPRTSYPAAFFWITSAAAAEFASNLMISLSGNARLRA